MANFNFSKDIPNILQKALKDNLQKMTEKTNIDYKSFTIETFKSDDSVEKEKLIIKTDNNESFFALIKKDPNNPIEYSFNTIYFYAPSILTQDFEDIKEIKENILPLFHKLTDLIKDKKNLSISLHSYFDNTDVVHVLTINKDGKVLNKVDIKENELKTKLNKGIASLLIDLKLDNLFSI